MRKWKGIALAALTAVSLFAFGAAAGCATSQEETSVEISDVLLDAAQDLHVKKGEQISVKLPDGVTLGTGKVDANKGGEYAIVYKKGNESVEKTAYVYDAPAFYQGDGEVATTRSLTYAEANAADFLSADSLGIVARDSFGKKLKISATPDQLYLGKYGDYTVTYTAKDAAGNEITTSVKYTVTGAEAPTATGSTADVTDESFSVSIDFGEAKLTEIAFDDIALKTEYYTATETGVTFDASLVEKLGLRAKTEYPITLKTDAWCAETTVNFVDEKPSVLGDFSCFNYIYLPGETIEMPVPVKTNRQGYEIFYALNGSEVDIDERNAKVTLDISKIGKYTLTATAKQDGKADVVRETTFTVCSQEEYDRIIAPCTTQFENEFGVRSPNWCSILYDPEMRAYKREVLWNEGNGHSSVMLNSGSKALYSMMNGYAKYPYVALDLCFDGVIGTDFYSFAFYFNGGMGKPSVQMNSSSVKIYDMDGYDVAHDDMQGGEWYTVYVPVTECIADYAGWGYYFMTQMSKTPAPPPREDIATGFNYTDYWIRNIRFENEKTEVSVKNGNIYEVSETQKGLLPKADEGYKIVSAPQGVAVENGNLISLATAGKYVLKAGNKQVSFTVYTKKEYAKIISPFNTAELVSILGSTAATGSVSFDETKGAAKYTFKAPNTSWYENTIYFSTSSAEFARMKAGRESNEYAWMAFDIQFEGTGGKGTDFNNFLMFPTGNYWKTNPGQFYQGNFSEIYRYNTNNVAVKLDQMVSGQWYTIYFPLTEANQIDSSLTYFRLLAMNPIVTTNDDGSKTAKNANYWIRNLRFESDLPTQQS